MSPESMVSNDPFTVVSPNEDVKHVPNVASTKKNKQDPRPRAKRTATGSELFSLLSDHLYIAKYLSSLEMIRLKMWEILEITQAHCVCHIENI